MKGDKSVYYSNSLGDLAFKGVPIPRNFPGYSESRKKGIKTIYQDRESNLWMADNNGLYNVKLTGNIPELVPIRIQNNDSSLDPSLPKVTKLYHSSDSIFWIGTQQRGLRKSNGRGNPLNQSFESFLENDRITAIVEDKLKDIWIGTYRGLVQYRSESKEFKRYPKQQGAKGTLSSNIIICLYKDRKENLWIGTPNGLNLAEIDALGNLSFKTYQVKDGLPNNYIHTILEDDHGNLWLSTNKGISKFIVQELSFYNYDVSDGLQSNSFMENVAFKDKKGKMYFGGINGINAFHPDSIISIKSPKVMITEFRVSGQEVDPNTKFNNRKIIEKSIVYSEDIALKSSENIFSIEFTALDYHSSSRYVYTYMMKGLDEDWSGITSQKSVTYSNLNPGNYEFMVKTVLDTEDDEAHTASLKILVLPPYWRTWPAFILYFMVFVGLLFLYRLVINQRHELRNKLNLSRLNRKKEEEIAEMKARFFTNVAHEIRTPLSLISGPVETLMEDTLNEDQKEVICLLYIIIQND